MLEIFNLFNKILEYENIIINELNKIKNILKNNKELNENTKEQIIFNLTNYSNEIKKNFLNLLKENEKIIEFIKRINLEEKKEIKKIDEFLFKKNKENKSLIILINEFNEFLKNKLDSEIRNFNISNINSFEDYNYYNTQIIRNLNIISENFSKLKKQTENLIKIFILFEKKKKKDRIKKKIILGLSSALIGISSLIFHTSNKEINQSNQLNEIKTEIKQPIYSQNKIITQNNLKNENYLNLKEIKNENIIQNNKPIQSEIIMNSKFNTKQKIYLKKFYKEYYLQDKTGKVKKYLKELKTYKILKNGVLNVSKINPKLTEILNNFAKKENVSLKLIIFMSLIESTFGKQNRSSMGARGPLQAMPVVMKANCINEYKYLIKKHGKEKGKKIFYNDLYIQILAGIREIKNIAKDYEIDISYQNDNFNIYDFIIIVSSYNSGRTNIRKHPEKIIHNKETNKYSQKALALLSKTKEIK